MPRLKNGISQRFYQSQRLSLTPSMRLKFKFWQMNIQELSRIIEQEFVGNPLLELVDRICEESTSDMAEYGYEHEALCLDYIRESAVLSKDAVLMDSNLPACTDLVQEMVGEISSLCVTDTCQASNHSDYKVSVEDRSIGTNTLREHLLMQLYCTIGTDDPLATYLELLIGYVDDRGFLRKGPELTSEVTPLELAQEFGITETKLLELVGVLQEFEPSGVGCFTLQESLLLQLRHAGVEPDDLVVRVIRDHCDLIVQRDSCRLRKAVGCSEQDLMMALESLKRLNPAPGRAFGCDVDGFAKPDIVVMKCDDDNYIIYLNNESIPQLRISGNYRYFLDVANTKEDKDFIRGRYRSAKDFLRSLEDRNRTVLKVSVAAIGLQMDFINKGVEHLKPMILRDVANITGFHESTISRVVRGKTIHTPHGLFDFSYLFSVGFWPSKGVEMVSATVAKHRIKSLINAENPTKPFSDETISNLMNRSGIHIARRTVGKYREELKIPSAYLRRRF